MNHCTDTLSQKDSRYIVEEQILVCYIIKLSVYGDWRHINVCVCYAYTRVSSLGTDRPGALGEQWKKSLCSCDLCVFALEFSVCCTWAGISLPLFVLFFLSVGAFIFLWKHGRAWSLCPLVHCLSCPQIFFALCSFLSVSLTIVGRCSPASPSFLPHPRALSLLYCSLCARIVSWALTSCCDPTEPRWLWYTVQPSW